MSQTIIYTRKNKVRLENKNNVTIDKADLL